MRSRPRKITLKELEPVIRYYQARLPGWDMILRDSLARTTGPILQCIGFDRLSSEDYRPVSFIRVLTAPEVVGAMELAQHLNARVGYVRLAEHERLRERVVDAMQREFVPKITRALDPIEVLKLYERKAIPKSPEAYSLAALNAYLGKKKRALYWCSRFNKLVDKLGHPWQEWDKERRAFLDRLERWIHEGTEKRHLEEILRKEKEKWGID